MALSKIAGLLNSLRVDLVAGYVSQMTAPTWADLHPDLMGNRVLDRTPSLRQFGKRRPRAGQRRGWVARSAIKNAKVQFGSGLK
jgi:hypothetical protein